MKKNERDVKALENLLDEAKRDIIKTFTEPSVDVIVDDIMNVNDQERETENRNRLEQSYGETIFSKNIVEREKREVEELAEKIKLSLDLFLRDCGENEKKKKKNSAEEARFKRRKSKCLIELKKKPY